MILSIIVAVTKNGVIGRDNGLPWRLSTDLRRFKALTMGKPILLGRKNYDSIGRALPGRPNIVITRDPDFSAEGVIVVHSLEDAIRRGEDEAAALGAGEVCVIGGGLDRADILHVTHIDAEIDGDTHFPPIDPAIWEAVASENVPAGEKDDFPTRFATYRRRPAA